MCQLSEFKAHQHTMGKVLILFITTTLQVAWLICATESREIHYIIPNNSTPCNFEVNMYDQYTCLTLEKFAQKAANQNVTFKANITLIIAPGKHSLTMNVQLNNTRSVTIKSISDNGNKPEITCKQRCFSFQNSSLIQIENLVFTECFSEDLDGGAIFVSKGQQVHISQCIFVNTLTRKRGGAMRLQLIDRVYIQESQFINNSAICKQSAISTAGPDCSRFCTAIGGAISSAYISSLIIVDSYFDSNTATCYGGALNLVNSLIYLHRCKFIRSNVQGFGGGLFIGLSRLVVSDSVFDDNYLGYIGGGMYTSSSTVVIHNCSFSFNSAINIGGAAYFEESNLFINHSYFVGNSATAGGAAAVVAISADAFISGSTFLGNRGGFGAGALHIELSGVPSCTFSCDKEASPGKDVPVVLITDCTFNFNIGILSSGAIFAFRGVLNITHSDFIENFGSFGGAINANFIVVYIRGNNFTNNIGNASGGALYLGNGTLYGSSNTYTNNTGVNGGAINAIYSTVESQNDRFFANIAYKGNGGAVHGYRSDITTIHCECTNNNANLGGGALFVNIGRYSSKKSLFTMNFSNLNGSALFLSASLVTFDGDSFRNNLGGQNFQAIFQLHDKAFNNEESSTIQLTNSRGICSNLSFVNNTGSLYLFYSILNFTSTLIFKDNHGMTGGALTLVQSTVSFEYNSQVIIANNTAIYGGGIFLSQSELRVYTHHLHIDNNIAKQFGGGIYGYQSRITVTLIQMYDPILLTRNKATHGGVLFAVATSLFIFHGSVVFSSNEAIRGGAAALSEGSKIYIQKTSQDFYNQFSIKLLFSNNSADYGGAIYVLDDSNSAVLCQQTAQSGLRPLSTNECFLQTLRLYYPRDTYYSVFNYINIFFQFNEGNKAGNDIFGGLLDRCQINAFSEIYNFGFRNELSGFDYLKTIVQFQIEFDYNRTIQPFNLQVTVSSITRQLVKDAISSDPVQLCFCEDITYNCSLNLPKISTRRGEMFSITAVTVDQVENPVNGTVLARVISDGTRLKVGQAQQVTAGKCTELVYNVFSTEKEATFEVFPNGPCSNNGISSKKVHIIFLPCNCPNGLQRAPLDNECRCECDSFVGKYASYCQLDSNTSITVVRRMSKYWIQYVISDNALGFQIQDCPYDYCVSTPVNLTINLPQNVDEQCAFNRSGIMCGECQGSLSLIFGSSRCVQCSNNYLALLIAFAAAGVALVALILVLNLTVATGTTHGIILYANIVAANSPTFLPQNAPLRTFVSWLNLDLGIETCFYDGMDSYAKVLLQLAFPIYIILLSILIIIVSNYWGWFAGLIGRKNPVATLCTLFLLSYSKLLRTIIACLQFTHLNYPDGSKEILWFYDPNILYFTPSRIPFFIIASIIIALGTVYTVLLFLAQWLRRISGKKLMRCFKSNKYNAFIDAYHASFVLKHRYWLGILLIVRIIHHILSALLEESTHLLIVSCMMCILLILKQLLNKVYKSRLIDLLESSFLINLLLFATSTYYINNTNGDQLGLANTSVSIVFITFIGIIIYHCHTYFFTSFRIYQALLLTIKNCRQTCKQKMGKGNTQTATAQRDTMHIQLLQRDPDLDIIAPITAKDYKPPTVTSTFSHEVKPVSSTTVVITK